MSDLTLFDINYAEGIGAISFEMAASVKALLREHDALLAAVAALRQAQDTALSDLPADLDALKPRQAEIRALQDTANAHSPTPSSWHYTFMDDAAHGACGDPAIALALFLHSTEMSGAKDVLACMLDNDSFEIKIGEKSYQLDKDEFRAALRENDASDDDLADDFGF